MGELMRANLFRLKRDKAFWACFGVMLCAAVAQLSIAARQCGRMAAEGYIVDLEGAFFRLAPAVGLLVGIFAGLYLGTDHSEGALRNRLMVGHSREKVYLAELGTTVTAALNMTGAWLAGCGAVALLHREYWHMDPRQLALYILVALGSAAALAAVLTAVGMLTEKKATAAVVSILLVLGLLMVSTWLYSRLLEPELESGLIMTAAGMEWGDPTPNPRYVGGAARQIFEVILNVLPTGQAVLLSEAAVVHPLWNLAASAAVAGISTLAGLALFGKKDLK